ncbi:MAG TPA: sigma 54-interacting transcriptional regulator [Nitrospirales bacterium]|nr:sigma 54-interacting transcriptional regulator [Nitrospirales bacterium]
MTPPTAIDDLHETDAAHAAELGTLEALRALLLEGGGADARLDAVRRYVEERLRVLHGREEHGFRRGEEPPGLHGSLVGESAAMLNVYAAVRRVSDSQATVLLRGESGTGKELVAKAIHQLGPRARAPFVRLHCAAVTESLLESELFGHERGAFTGAVETRKGRFEMADGGSLFLDEIGDIPLGTQVKLLRVLQEKCFERVGGSRAVTVDVRVISATHRDLEAMVRDGSFREDLYYRLNVVPITLPPLRERTGDIQMLIEHFLARFNRDNRRRVRLSADVLALMARYHWPGNVRELQNCVERLVVMTESDREALTLETIPASLRGYFGDMQHVTGGHRAQPSRAAAPLPLRADLEAREREGLVEALRRHGWVQARAARTLGLSPRQVAYKIRKYGIREP